ncbi:MAG: DNA polymerase/3'-5' exonuclease PolX [bacterium]|nr:DNA polymerase/3'-5' exonuclease PolX [bacterium]
MTNQEIAKILYEISAYLEMQDVAFKPRAYEKVAEVVESLSEPLTSIHSKGGIKAIQDVPGVGISIAETIEELIKTGHSKHYEELKKNTPVDLANLIRVEGLGPKKIKALYNKLGVRNLKDLEKSAKAGKIRKLAGFGPKSEENILKGLDFLSRSSGRFTLGAALPLVRETEDRLRGLKGVKKAQVAGSIRRWKETVGDVDILVVSDKAELVMDYFINMPEVGRVLAHGKTKSAITLKNGLDVDLRVLPPESYGSALAYFTGSKAHNVALRQIAINKGYKLNEYGLFKGERQIAGKTEEEIYKKLGLDYVEPELRELTGEVEAAQEHILPNLIKRSDLRGDLQVQTNWTDGEKSIKEMASAAMKSGLEYIVITDHTKRLAMTNGLDERRIVQQMKEIDKVNAGLKAKGLKFTILKGSECDILKDGTMDLSDSTLSKLDVVGASVHSHFNLPREDQTKRIQKAISNPSVDILFHPTGRLIQRREAYAVDMGAIIDSAKKTKTVLEIDAFPDRLDLKDEYIRQCVEVGVKMSIDSDAHTDSHFSVLEYGVAQARRGWAKRSDIINAWPVSKMLKFLK